MWKNGHGIVTHMPRVMFIRAEVFGHSCSCHGDSCAPFPTCLLRGLECQATSLLRGLLRASVNPACLLFTHQFSRFTPNLRHVFSTLSTPEDKFDFVVGGTSRTRKPDILLMEHTESSDPRSFYFLVALYEIGAPTAGANHSYKQRSKMISCTSSGARRI